MPRVLIVDDFSDARDLLSTYFASEGFETEEAVDGEDAVARATERPPDVILMDIAMPRMDGVTATLRLREDPRTAVIPVIAVTGQAHHPSDVSPPCDSVLVKPVDPVRVLHEIRRLLGERASNANMLGAARAASLPARRASAKSASQARRGTVWLVVPDGEFRDAMMRRLEDDGFDVHVFASEDESRGHPSEIGLDAVVVDLERPSALEWTLEMRGQQELEDLVIMGVEARGESVPHEVSPLFDAISPREVDRVADLLRRAFSFREPNTKPAEVSVAVGDLIENTHGHVVGTVLDVRREFLMVAVPHAGAFVIPASAVVTADQGRIVVDPEECEDELRRAITVMSSS
jgi:CheY-like chemotaxis protein